MGNNLKFEFDFDEVFEGIKQGVIKELTETNFDAAKNNVICQLKDEIKNKIYLTYGDENELKDEIKNEIKDKVFEKFLEEAKKEYKVLYEDYFNGLISKEMDKTEKTVKQEIKSRTVNKLYDDLYSSIKREMSDKLESVISKFVNNLGVNNLKVTGTDKMITKEEYDSLVHRSETLEALEQGGVDNWEWYSESLQRYFGDDDE
jgi:citrate lyase gamma subunit